MRLNELFANKVLGYIGDSAVLIPNSDIKINAVIQLIIKVLCKRFWIKFKDKIMPHKHYFRRGDVMANPESNFCRCYLCGDNVNIMED